MTDTALKTANFGYLTRGWLTWPEDDRSRKDCGTDRGLEVTTNGNENDRTLYDRILGRYTMKSVFNPNRGRSSGKTSSERRDGADYRCGRSKGNDSLRLHLQHRTRGL